MVHGFFQAIVAADSVLAGTLAGVLIARAVGVYVAVAWVGVTMAALVAGHIQSRTGGMG